MGYYADGRGSITFKNKLPSDVEKQIGDILVEAFECEVYSLKDSTTTADIFCNEKYYEETVKETLSRVSKIAEIESGEIAYIGEDNFIWHFVWRNGSWVEENGHVEYTDMTFDRLKQAFLSYIDNDLAVAEPGYVRDVLTDTCGLTSAEIKELGLDWLFPEGGELSA